MSWKEKRLTAGSSTDLLILFVENNRRDTIVDSGASTFVPFWHYITGNRIPQLLAGMGRELVIHTVVTGGQAQEETVAGFSQLAGQFTEQVSFVIWLNPYFGPVTRERRDFEEFNEYIDLKDRVSAIVRMPQLARIFSARPLGYVAATPDIRPGFADALFYHHYQAAPDNDQKKLLFN